MNAPRFPRFLHECVEEPPTGFPRKTVAFVGTAQGSLTLAAVLETATGDRVSQRHQLWRSDALDLIAALSEWVASPDSILRESSDGTPVPVQSSEPTRSPEPASRVSPEVMAARGLASMQILEAIRQVPRAALDRVARLDPDAGPSLALVCQLEISRRDADLAHAAADALRGITGVEAAFLEGTTIFAVAREHGLIERERILSVEERLAVTYGDLEIHVRAHQGRGVDSLTFGKAKRIV